MKCMMLRERVFNVKLVAQQFIDMAIADISKADKAGWTLIEDLKKKSSVIFRIMTDCDVAPAFDDGKPIA